MANVQFTFSQMTSHIIPLHGPRSAAKTSQYILYLTNPIATICKCPDLIKVIARRCPCITMKIS